MRSISGTRIREIISKIQRDQLLQLDREISHPAGFSGQPVSAST